MLDAEAKAAQQRSFYLKLSPQAGQTIAETMGGFLPPGVDSQEAELRDNMALWFKLHHSGGLGVVMDTAWWMTKIMDRQGRMSFLDTTLRTNELSSFAVATIGLLMEQGVLQFVKEPEIPKLVTSTYNPDTADIEQAILDRLEASLNTKDETDE